MVVAAAVLGLALPALCPAFQTAGAGAEYVFDTPSRDGVGKRYFERSEDAAARGWGEDTRGAPAADAVRGDAASLSPR